jgi:beta-glucosidase
MTFRTKLPAKLKTAGLALLGCVTLINFDFKAAADEVGGAGKRVVISGDFSHSATQKAVVTGAPAGQEAAFHQEVYGPQFTLSVPGLETGVYTVIIGLVENFFDQAGGRSFDITAGPQTLAQNLDIFAQAGGKGRVLWLTNTINFKPAAGSGTLALTFTARANNAKFNTFELRNAAGKPVTFLRAAELAPDLVGDDPAALQAPVVAGPELWKDYTQPTAARVEDLVRRLSLAEKVSQLNCDAPGIPRLGIPAYSYRNECLHGLQPQSGYATVFPEPIGMASAWDPALIQAEADVIATEARATHNDYIARHNGDSLIHFGLDFYSPNINLFRDPRWGRGQETYGEDPFLTGRTAIAFIKGLQGDNPKYYKAIAGVKHYAVHSGPESERHRFNAQPDERDLYETYLPAFETAVREGQVDLVMGAYSSLYGVPDCANHFLLTDLLRNQWGFNGVVVSDGGAIYDINNHHKYVPTPEAAAAVAVKAGDDMCSGPLKEYYALTRAVRQGLISEAEIDTALRRALEARFRLGVFDPPAQVPFAQITIAENNTPEHEALALKVARESIVLLKNDGLLPLDRTKLKRIAVIGANADSIPVLLGNYHGEASRPVTILAGLRSLAGAGLEVTYALGGPLATKQGGAEPSASEWTKAIATAAAADVVIYVGGISAQLEGEEMRVDFDGFNGGDRTRIELPEVQTRLLQALHATGKPVVFVNCSGSAIAMPWAVENIPAILQAWYPGEQGGRAVAEVLFGDVNPGGHLPVTFYRATQDLPDFENYSMSNRTYRYFSGQPEFAFGHGLSYTTFDFRGAALDRDTFGSNDTVKISFTVANSGARAGDEVAQVYFRHVHSAVAQPKLALCGFIRLPLAAGAAAPVTLEIPTQRFRYWDVTRKQYVVAAGDYELGVGDAADHLRWDTRFRIADDH